MKTGRFKLGVLAACAMVLGAHVRAVNADGSFTLGDQWWLQTAPEAKFREFRDVPRGPFLEALLLEKLDNRNTYEIWGLNGIRKDQAWHGTWAWGSKLSTKIGWVETPHRFAFTTRTPYTEIRPGVFSLPDSLQALNRRVPANNSVANALQDALNSSPTFPLQFSTDVATASVRLRPKRGWMVEVNGRQTTRDGKKAYAAFIGTSPGNPTVELWEPIHQTLIDGDVRVNYNNDRVTVQAIGSTALFDNHLERMTWDNARSLYDIPAVKATLPPRGDSIASVPGHGQLALPPDNREMRGSVAIGLHLPSRSSFSGTVSYAQIRQDQDWLPVTVNSALRPDTIPMPGTNTDGKADLLNLDARLTTRAVDRWRGTLRFHSDKYDNKTPEFPFKQIVTGDVVKAGPFETRPFGNNNWVAGVDLDADPMEKVSVGATAELRTRERTHREVEKDKENVFGLRASVRPMEGLSLDAKARYGDRKLDEFIIDEYQEAGVFVEQPTLRRPDIANRKQLQASAGAWWMPIERVDVSANYSHVKNDYKDLDYGLKKDQSDVVATQGVLHVNPRLDLRGGYGYSLTKTSQRSITGLTGTIVTGPGRDTLAWTADIDDQTVYVNTGFDLWVKPEKLSIVGDYEFSRDKAEFDLTPGPAFTSPFVSPSNRFTGNVPKTFYRRHEVAAEARYQLLESTQISLRYAWEEFDIEDFAAKDIPQVAAGAAALYLGDFFQDYRAHRVALLAKYTF